MVFKSVAMKRRLRSIKTRIVIIPLVLLFIIIAYLSFNSAYTTRTNMLQQKRQLGIELANLAAARVEDNASALETVEEMLGDTLTNIIDMVLGAQDILTNDYLTTLADRKSVV